MTRPDEPAATDPVHLFVYGTLMRGGCRSAVLAGCEFLGPARTRPAFRLLDLGAYPGLVDGHAAIDGELYAVSAGVWRSLGPQLDTIEGVAIGLYERITIPLAESIATPPIEAVTYRYLGPCDDAADAGSRWVEPPGLSGTE